ncbi:MAG: prephenate dehydrogenase/arogenate dehydrogenase family protein [Candidatus Hydrogenedens sp.]|jgi:prephenate dehydrogenase|nr:prephenate dehydrogenase/arogenate dehydrogenase family protein [Candidatus Hydrogenedens sp.]
MTIGFERITIIGVGLLGASLGLALKKRGSKAAITGVGRRQESLDTALRLGAVDTASLDPLEASLEADLVVIATPVQQVIPLLELLAPRLSPQCLILDVASVKKDICAHARRLFPLPRRFVGCHPMAGSEKSGPEHGNADLYEGTVCLLECSDDLAEETLAEARSFWEFVGTRVIEMDPAQHDDFLARTSHLPHVAAAAVAQIVHDSGASRSMIGQGFLDVTRIAASRAEIWRDISLSNREALLGAIRELRNSLDAFESALEKSDAREVEAFFVKAAEARHKVISS